MALAGLFGPIAYFIPRALPILLVLMGLSAALATSRLRAAGPGRLLTHFAPALPLLAWALLSAIWSIDPGASFVRALRLVLEFAIGAFFLLGVVAIEKPLSERLLRSAVVGFAVGSLGALLDLELSGALTAWGRSTGSASMHVVYSRGAVVHAMLAVPLALSLWRTGHTRFAGLALAAGLATWRLGQLSAELAFPLALVAALTVLAVPALRYLIVAAPIVIVAAVPLVLPLNYSATVCSLATLKPSALHRVAIWNFAYERWLERPLLGWGLETSRRLPGGKQQVDIAAACGLSAQPASFAEGANESMPLHPHSFALQVWLELGAGGALAMIASLALLLRCAARLASGRIGQAGLAAYVVPATFVATVSFGIWQGWWIAALFLAGGFTALACRAPERHKIDRAPAAAA